MVRKHSDASPQQGEAMSSSPDMPYVQGTERAIMTAEQANYVLGHTSAEQQRLFGIDKLNVARSAIPAVTHVDYSARVQTVHADTNPRFHALISRFKAKTGCPVLVNTSFNVRGEPIVGTPQDAYRCFLATDMDALVLEDCVLRKEELKEELTSGARQQYLAQFQLD